MNYKGGSLWRKWDLHVHTPCSIINNYGADTEGTWQRFLEDLENLPQAIKVLGINDYIFIDGYRKIRKARSEGRLKNIDLILPVIELRLDKFGGSRDKLSRVNFHVIFSDELDPDIIDQQFLKTLPNSYRVSPQHAEAVGEWKAVASRDSIEDLGQRIIASVPESKRNQYHSPIVEGFNNLNFNLDDVLDRLGSHYFKGKHLTAVGKTEWADINWNDKSVAEKKTIINSAHLVFIASKTPADYHVARKSLTDGKVNDVLLDCSDAHHFSNSKEKDRIGNCFCWIKSDTTFDGLRLARIEPEERIFVGNEPPIIGRVGSAPTRYIRSVEVSKTKGSGLKETWFKTNLELNHGLVAVIGNRGSGKSALADVIGLLGNCKTEDDFSFLHGEKFRKPPEKKARHFNAKLTWEAGESSSANLMDSTIPAQVERVKYIPQNYFETICNELGYIEESAFDRELKEVIFSHVPEVKRLGKNSLSELVEYRGEEIYQAVENSRSKLRKINERISSLEAKLEPEYREGLQSRLDSKVEELAALEAGEPGAVEEPTSEGSDATDEIRNLEQKREELEKEREEKSKQLDQVSKEIVTLGKLKERLDAFQSDYAEFVEGFNEASIGVGLSAEVVITLSIDTTPISRKLNESEERQTKLTEEVGENEDEGIRGQLGSIDAEISGLRETLDEEHQAYQEQIEKRNAWEAKKKEVMGSKDELDSIANLKSRISDISVIPETLSKLRKDRISKTRGIYRNLKQLSSVLSELYGPIQSFFESHENLRESLNLEFDVSLVDTGLLDGFFEFIDQSVKGSFIGKAEGRSRLQAIVDNFELNNETRTLNLIAEIENHLQQDIRTEKKVEKRISEQLKQHKKVEDLYQFLYSLEYLEPRYLLKLDGKNLTQLSPGQRGALLIVFYLLIDKDTKPLIIDQPEHNLDNETVTQILVPAIRQAKNRRQVILITHNPILAVVCNADQVVSCDLDIKTGYSLTYESGAIENPVVNRRIVDVLEGTMVAFDNRKKKYLREFFADFPFSDS